MQINYTAMVPDLEGKKEQKPGTFFAALPGTSAFSVGRSGGRTAENAAEAGALAFSTFLM